MNTPTQVTLLDRLREASDPLAWDEFFQRYWRLIFTTARRRSPADKARPLADDGPLAALADTAPEPDAEWQRRFDLATIASLLDVQHVGRTDHVLFILMDPADDISGKPATNDATYRPATLALRLEQGQLTAGLAHLHAAGMVHRDMKPSNCLFVGRDLKLADFGLLSPASSQLSRLGTVRYMPPDGLMDLRADVYAARRAGAEIAADPRLAHLNRVALAAASRFRRQAVAAALLAVAVAPAALAISMLLPFLSMSTAPQRRDRPPEATAAVVPATSPLVNFITEPLGAAVLIDGTPYRDADGAPSTTPVTLAVPAGGHRVTFQHPQRGTLDAGVVDFSTAREVVARWP